MTPTDPTPESIAHTASIGALEDAPAIKARYFVGIGGELYAVVAYDAYHAERIARRQWRAEHDVAPNTDTPEAVAEWVGKAVTK